MATRKPTKLMKLKGTYEKSKCKRIDDTLPMLLPETVIDVPESLTNENIKSQWTLTTKRLLLWGLLSEIDLPELEEGFLLLQELKKINDTMKNIPVEDDTYGKYLGYKIKTLTAFHSVLKNYGMTPVERTKLSLVASEIKKNDSILDQIKKDN
jgi:hypothetical protein